MWCGDCYSLKDNDMFHISRMTEFKDEDKGRMESRWGKKGQREGDYLRGRNGDHLMCPFECDTCVFRKLRGVDPRSSSVNDNLLMTFIRRANLDAFWSRASSTVYGNRDTVREMLRGSEFMGLSAPFVHAGHILRMIIAVTRWQY